MIPKDSDASSSSDDSDDSDDDDVAHPPQEHSDDEGDGSNAENDATNTGSKPLVTEISNSDN